RAVDGMEEGQDVHAAEESGERPGQQLAQAPQRAAEPVGVADELDRVAHQAVCAASSAPCSRACAGLRSQLMASPASSSSANTVASTKPARGVCQASLTAPMASGPAAAASAVKNRITPAAAPCWWRGKQLMALELSV